MSSFAICIMWLYVGRPPEPRLIQDSNTIKPKKIPQYKLSLPVFVSFIGLALTTHYWWLQIDPRPNLEWEIVMIVFLTTIRYTAVYYMIQNQQRNKNTISIVSAEKDKRNKWIKLVVILANFALYILGAVYGLYHSSTEHNHHPYFGWALFSAALFLFILIQSIDVNDLNPWEEESHI